MSKMKEYLLDQYEQQITPEIDDLIKMKEEEEGNGRQSENEERVRDRGLL